MSEVTKERIAAHRRAYNDLVPWIQKQFDAEISVLLPSAQLEIIESVSREHMQLIDGAYVRITLKEFIDSEILDYLNQCLGAKDYTIKAYPMSRLVIKFKVKLANPCKSAMTATGMWTPNYRRDEQKSK